MHVHECMGICENNCVASKCDADFLRVKVVRRMLASTGYGVCGVKSRSVFPDLLPSENEVVLTLQRRAQLALSQFSASCREVVAGVPLFALCMVVGMYVLASF